MGVTGVIFRRIAALLLVAVCCNCISLFAVGGKLRQISAADIKHLRADSWRAVGRNLIIEGNVYLPAGPYEVYADQIVLNMDSGDFEASGNVRFFRWIRGKVAVTANELADIEKRSNMFVHGVTNSVSPWGKVSYTADVSYQSDRITADKASGNVKTSFFRFDNLVMQYGAMVCRADSAEHRSNGEVVLKNGEVSACNYLESNNAHYSVSAASIYLKPHEARFYDLKYAGTRLGDRTIFMLNGAVKIYGVPVLWLPVFYKPKDESPGICGFHFGKATHFGYFINLYRTINFSDAPGFSVKLHADWYEKRGFGYGASGKVETAESRTDFIAYAIYDKSPEEQDDYNDYRLHVPKFRYDFRISNITHITPRLDFRGVFERQSDYYFRRDFFRSRYNADPQPATFAALEQQFDNFSVAAYARIRANDFYTTVEKLPEIRFDAQRQEIMNTGLYYQGDLSAAYMRMKWIEFDKPPRGGGSLLRDYEAFRLDTTHFLYYPIATKYFTLVPRAGVKLTAYSDSSEHKVESDELISMFSAAQPDGFGRQKFTGYDDKGGSKFRLAAEVGFELSGKFHNTWQNVRSNFFRIDGLRHIFQPYMNYTYIPKPTVDRAKLYYFDDIDRIAKQNFVRLGMVNRLQTRNDNSIETFFRMENYVDIHLEKDDGQKNLGNLGTLLSLRVLKGLTINTQFLIDLNDDGEVEDNGHFSLGQSWLNMLNFNINYSPAKFWSFSAGYNYIRPYDVRSAYSMGSTLTQINSSSYFERYYNSTSESFYIAAGFPLTPDNRTLGNIRMTYDVREGYMDYIGFMVMRQFHCWQLIAALGFDRNDDPDEDKWDIEYSISANLTGLGSNLDSVQNTVLRNVGSMSLLSF